MHSQTTPIPSLTRQTRDLIIKSKIALVNNTTNSAKSPSGINSKRSHQNVGTSSQFHPTVNFPIQFRDQLMTDHQIQQLRPQTQQKYNNLWQDVSNIHHQQLKEQAKLIEQTTKQSQKQLEDNYFGAKQQHADMVKQVRELHQNSHKLYEKLQALRYQQSRADIKRRQLFKQLKQKHRNLLSSELLNLLPDKQQYAQLIGNIKALKQQIGQLDKTIEIKSNQVKLCRKRTKQTKQQLTRYLVEALKQGLDYRDQGLAWIVAYLNSLGFQILPKHMPTILDQKSIQHLLNKGRYFVARSQKHPSRSYFSTERSQHKKPQTRLPSLSMRFAGSEANIVDVQKEHSSSKVKLIYNSTKDLIGKIIKDRQKTLTSNPIVGYQPPNLRQPDAQQSQKDYIQYQRILNAYPRELHRTICKMMFGIRKPIK